jgi:hypothetical protein
VRHRGRLRCAGRSTESRRLALDVCDCGRARPPCHHRAFFITESANWLHTRGATDRATEAARRLLFRKSQYPGNIVLMPQSSGASGNEHGGGSFLALFGKRYSRATILASVP